LSNSQVHKQIISLLSSGVANSWDYQSAPMRVSVAVLRAIKTGRVPLEPDGTVDAAKADAWCPLRSALEGPSSWTSLLWSLERRGAQAELPFCVWAHPIP
jgi:hypothetical protein